VCNTVDEKMGGWFGEFASWDYGDESADNNVA